MKHGGYAREAKLANKYWRIKTSITFLRLNRFTAFRVRP